MCILITKQPWSLTKSSKTPMTIGLKRKSPPSPYKVNTDGQRVLRFTSEGRALLYCVTEGTLGEIAPLLNRTEH